MKSRIMCLVVCICLLMAGSVWANIYGARTDNWVTAMSDTGTLLWNYTPGAGLSSIKTDNAGNVYIGRTDGVITKLNSAGGFIANTPNWGQGILGFDVRSDGALYASYNGGNLVKFNSNLTVNAQLAVGTVTKGVSVSSNGHVYINRTDQYIDVINAATMARVQLLDFRSWGTVLVKQVETDALGFAYLMRNDGYVTRMAQGSWALTHSPGWGLGNAYADIAVDEATGKSVVARSDASILTEFNPDMTWMANSGGLGGITDVEYGNGGTVYAARTGGWITRMNASDLSFIVPNINLGVEWIDIAITPIPEPATLAILGLGAVLLRRKK